MHNAILSQIQTLLETIKNVVGIHDFTAMINCLGLPTLSPDFISNINTFKDFCQDLLSFKQTIHNQLQVADSQSNIFQALNQTKDHFKKIIEESGPKMTEGELEATLDILNNKSNELKQEFETLNQKMASFDLEFIT